MPRPQKWVFRLQQKPEHAVTEHPCLCCCLGAPRCRAPVPALRRPLPAALPPPPPPLQPSWRCTALAARTCVPLFRVTAPPATHCRGTASCRRCCGGPLKQCRQQSLTPRCALGAAGGVGAHAPCPGLLRGAVHRATVHGARGPWLPSAPHAQRRSPACAGAAATCSGAHLRAAAVALRRYCARCRRGMTAHRLIRAPPQPNRRPLAAPAGPCFYPP